MNLKRFLQLASAPLLSFITVTWLMFVFRPQFPDVHYSNGEVWEGTLPFVLFISFSFILVFLHESNLFTLQKRNRLLFLCSFLFLVVVPSVLNTYIVSIDQGRSFPPAFFYFLVFFLRGEVISIFFILFFLIYKYVKWQ